MPDADGRSGADDAPARSARSPAALLRDRTFGPFIFGRLASHLSVWIHNLAAAILVFELTGSAFLVGMVTVAQFLPQVLFSTLGGSLSDRYDRRAVLIAGRAPAGISCLVLAGVVATTSEPQQVLVAVYGVSALAGLGWALGVPAGHALTPALVERESLTSGITLTALTGQVSRMVGPAITGVILFVGEMWMAFAVAGVGHLVFVVVLLRIRSVTRPEGPASKSGIIPGIRYVVRQPLLLLPIVSGVIVSLGLEPMVTLAPSLMVELGADGAAATTLATAFGFGAVSVVSLLGRMQRRFGIRRTAVIGLLTVGGGLGIVSVLTTVQAVVLAFVVAGVGSTIAVVSLQSWIQHLVDDAYRGRVMSLWALMFLGSRTLSASLLGWLSDLLGAGNAASLAGLGCALGACLIVVVLHSLKASIRAF